MVSNSHAKSAGLMPLSMWSLHHDDYRRAIKKKGKGNKRKEPTAHVTMENLCTELVSNGILQQPLQVPWWHRVRCDV